MYLEELTGGAKKWEVPIRGREPPGRRIRRIQLCYNNRFGSVWEYKRAFLAGEIDWRSVIGAKCPLCGREGGYREIEPYERGVIDLFPYRSEMVPVARFQCRAGRGTFSLLPCQLAPYHQYTIESMVFAVLLWRQIFVEEGLGAAAAVAELPGDSCATPWLLERWLEMIVAGCRRAHAAVSVWCDLDSIGSAGDRAGQLDELHAYVVALGGRDPPSRLGFRQSLERYGRATGRHLFGIPSQERRGASRAFGCAR